MPLRLICLLKKNTYVENEKYENFVECRSRLDASAVVRSGRVLRVLHVAPPVARLRVRVEEEPRRRPQAAVQPLPQQEDQVRHNCLL